MRTTSAATAVEGKPLGHVVALNAATLIVVKKHGIGSLSTV